MQDYGPSGVMQSAGNRFKIMVYNYDLISGKVNQVSYQPGQLDGFYHQYSYDAENRIIGVRSSQDSIQWQNDASYTYYRHGPLAREQIGDLQLQGIDYAYTVQGWLKSINPSWITPSGAAGQQYDSDGMSSPALFERDTYKLNLNYFDDGTYTDFTPISPQAGYVQGNRLPSDSKKNLYNGNIGSMAIDIRALATTGSKDLGPMIYNYGYDQLNRISCMNAWAASDSLKPIGTGPLSDYAERYTYDPNGNILTLNRTGDSLHPAKAKLTYNYIYKKTGSGTGEYVPGSAPTSGVAGLTNQLSSIQVSDSGSMVVNPNELTSQSAFNYQYNEIGQLTADSKAQISGVVWNVYGKILSLSDSSHPITFTYDAAGNRISKAETRNDTTITTWYVRDAQGNVMSIYTENPVIHSDSLTQTEADIYGSSRLGVLNLSVNCAGSLTQPTLFSLVRGSKLFELTNHLGNVLETISDKKIQHTSDNSTVDYYLADVINANDYYSFGMGMPGRSYTAGSANSYRYGFNGKEQDPEVKGPDNQYDYGMRMYDPRVGRFLSGDPLTKDYLWQTPYAYNRNSPIAYVDWEGQGDPPYEKSNVHFVPLHNPFVAVFLRKDNETFTQAAANVQTAGATMYSINMQQYGLHNVGTYNYYTSSTPLPNSNFVSQGYSVADNRIISGKSSPETFYFAQDAKTGQWSFGQGDAPKHSAVAFGGGIPILINGLAYGETNKYTSDAPAGLPLVGDPGAENQKYLIQRSSKGYLLQNNRGVGKSIVAFNSKNDDFLIISQQDGIDGMSLDEIRDYLKSKGFDNALSFDGSSSATLVTNNQSMTNSATKQPSTIVKPKTYKNDAIPVGASFTDTSNDTSNQSNKNP